MSNALTLHQPWATLIALGVKHIETRSWPAPKSAIGHRLIIHAGVKRPPSGGQTIGGWWIRRGDHEVPDLIQSLAPPYPVVTHALPLGAVVASCTLTACVPMVGLDAVVSTPYLRVMMHESRTLTAMRLREFEPAVPIDDQLPYGDFAPGRWAWLLDDIKPTTERCPACWGKGGRVLETVHPDTPDVWIYCRPCDGTGHCDPVPAKGRQGLWKWAS